MKTRSFSLLLVAALTILAAFALNSKEAGADPEDGGMTYVSLLPFLSKAHPPGPPKLALVPFATGFNPDTITAITHANDERLFVLERKGRIRIVQPDGTLLAKPYLDMSGKVVTDNWEEGVTGLVFHPNYPAVPYFFVAYTPDNDHVRVSRFTRSENDPDSADAASEAVLMNILKKGDIKGADYRVHHAGDLHFGPDGMLYIAIGDGGPDPHGTSTSGDPHRRGQTVGDLLANMLRINVDESGAGREPDCGSDYYSIPYDNPYASAKDSSCDEIWAVGLRNPYRFSFDRLTGDMYIGDVGETKAEEINFQPAGSPGGENYGWACYEGIISGEKAYCRADTQFTFPIHEYDQPHVCASVIGGYVYRGQKYPRLYGYYVFADFCSFNVWLLSPDDNQGWTKSDAVQTNFYLSTFGEDINGELYAGEWNLQKKQLSIYKLTTSP